MPRSILYHNNDTVADVSNIDLLLSVFLGGLIDAVALLWSFLDVLIDVALLWPFTGCFDRWCCVALVINWMFVSMVCRHFNRCCCFGIVADRKYETVIVPIFGSPTPFHISTVKVGMSWFGRLTRRLNVTNRLRYSLSRKECQTIN